MISDSVKAEGHLSNPVGLLLGFPQADPSPPRRFPSALQSRHAHDPVLAKIPGTGSPPDQVLTVTGRNDLPDGDYGFIELYCNEPDCDCRRVTVVVLRPQTGWKIWATISYGWESPDFYQPWAKAPDPLDPSEWQGPYLDPLAEQAQYSPVLLDLFQFLLQSPGYVQRLKNHYQLFRLAVEEELAKREGTERSQLGRSRRRRHGRKRVAKSFREPPLAQP
jgi:hypothetical protein